ncbi:MAG: TVP38/TMEM64 family protein [Bacillota bacterium]|nr:TVP38/TMEM64 family protein [Bacillota bacterium]
MENSNESGRNDNITSLFGGIMYYRYEMLAGLVSGALLSLGYLFIRDYGYALMSAETLKEVISGFGKAGIVVFILMMVLQVVVFFVPGEFLQAAGGYIYGVGFGSVLSGIGIALGSMLVFWIARKLGRPFLERIISKRNLTFFKSLLNSKDEGGMRKRRKALIIVFFIYFIPGLPKDAVAYIAGITDMKICDFLAASMLARLPGIVISTSFGYGIYSGNKLTLLFIAASMVLIFVFGSIKGKKFIEDNK